jgi:large-conductance mechanosensitive channel
MKKIIKSALRSLIALALLAGPAIALAQEKSNSLLDRLKTVGGGGGYQTDPSIASTPIIIGLLIRAFLSFLGITFVILMVIAGYNWMTAQGNDETVTKAKQTIRASIIGVIVAIGGWAIWDFVFRSVIK